MLAPNSRRPAAPIRLAALLPLLFAGCYTALPAGPRPGPPLEPGDGFARIDGCRPVSAAAQLEAVYGEGEGAVRCRVRRGYDVPLVIPRGKWVLAVGQRFGGGGHSLEFERVERVGDDLVARYVVFRPGRGCAVTTAVTYGSALAQVEAAPGTVLFERREAVYDCEG